MYKALIIDNPMLVQQEIDATTRFSQSKYVFLQSHTQTSWRLIVDIFNIYVTSVTTAIEVFNMVQEADDSTSEESSNDEGNCDSTGIKKQESFIQRLKRILKWLLLPNAGGINSPFPISWKKSILITYFTAADVEPSMFTEWFIPPPPPPVVNN